MRQQSRNTMTNLGDPRFTNGAPAGVEHVDTHGAVTQAMYLHPVFRVQPFSHKLSRLSLLFGAVIARAPDVVADPYQSYLNGGVPTGPRGAKQQSYLGTEFDSGLQYQAPIAPGLDVLMRVDVGVLFPGHAFDAADGTPAPAVGAVDSQIALRGTW